MNSLLVFVGKFDWLRKGCKFSGSISCLIKAKPCIAQTYYYCG